MTPFDDSGALNRILELEKEVALLRTALQESSNAHQRISDTLDEVREAARLGNNIASPAMYYSPVPINIDLRSFGVTVTLTDHLIDDAEYDARLRVDLSAQFGQALLREGFITIEKRALPRDRYTFTQQVEYVAKIYTGKKK